VSGQPTSARPPAAPRTVGRPNGRPPAPRLALRRSEAAQALGISDEHFDQHVRDHLAVVRLGTVRLYPVAELQRFLAERAEPVLGPRSRSLVPPFGPAPEAGSRRLEKGRRKRASAAERPL
jgi:hypothetical protein